MLLKYIIFIFRLIYQNLFLKSSTDFKQIKLGLTKIKPKNKDFQIISNYRKNLLQDSSPVIDIKAGAGSRINKFKNNTVQHIAKHSSTSRTNGKTLHKIVKFFEPINIIGDTFNLVMITDNIIQTTVFNGPFHFS